MVSTVSTRRSSTNDNGRADATKTHTFHSRDGLYYESYQAMRAANVAHNKAHLQSLGLDKFKPITREKQVRRVTPPARGGGSVKHTWPREPTRRSSRQRLGPVEYVPDPFTDPEDLVRHHKRSKNISTGPKIKGVRTALTLTDEEKAHLQNMPDWVNAMDEYLDQEEHLSRDNRLSVMRQVRRLVVGVGIRYRHWGDNVIFCHHRRVHLGMDFDALHQECIDFEHEHGRDLGNGWLIRHPVKKLGNYQRFAMAGRNNATGTA